MNGWNRSTVWFVLYKQIPQDMTQVFICESHFAKCRITENWLQYLIFVHLPSGLFSVTKQLVIPFSSNELFILF